MRADLVVVGASLAGLRAVEGARQAGFDGSIILVGAEEHLPYNRPPLSKDHLAAEELNDSTFRSRATLEELGVELVLGAPATALDLSAACVAVDGREVGYGRLVLATGRTPALCRRRPLRPVSRASSPSAPVTTRGACTDCCGRARLA